MEPTDHFLSRLAANGTDEISDDSFTELMRSGLMTAALHDTAEYPTHAFFRAAHISSSTVRRYCLGTVAPAQLMRKYVLRDIHKHLTAAVHRFREQQTESVHELRAFNMLIQQPDFDGKKFFETANQRGFDAAISEVVDPVPAGSKPTE